MRLGPLPTKEDITHMAVIHKYIIQPSPEIQHITVPNGSRIVSCGVQGGQIAMWVMRLEHGTPQSDNAKLLQYMVVGTRWNIDDTELYPKFRGTVQIDGYVWHVIEMQDIPF